MASQDEEAVVAKTTTPIPQAAAPAPLLRLKLAGPQATAVVGVCRARALRHQQEREEKEEKGDEVEDELEEAAREVRWTTILLSHPIGLDIGFDLIGFDAANHHHRHHHSSHCTRTGRERCP